MVTSGGEPSSQGNFSLPSGPNFHSSRPPSSSNRSKKKNWSSRNFSFRTSSRPDRASDSREQEQDMTREQSHTPSGGNSTAQGDKWWKIHLLQGMVNDIRRRAPYYWSDWADAWDYRVVPATIYMYFAKYGPEKCNYYFLLPFNFLISFPCYCLTSSTCPVSFCYPRFS